MSLLSPIAGIFAMRTGWIDFFCESDMVRAGWDRRADVGEGWAKRLEMAWVG